MERRQTRRILRARASHGAECESEHKAFSYLPCKPGHSKPVTSGWVVDGCPLTGSLALERQTQPMAPGPTFVTGISEPCFCLDSYRHCTLLIIIQFALSI